MSHLSTSHQWKSSKKWIINWGANLPLFSILRVLQLFLNHEDNFIQEKTKNENKK